MIFLLLILLISSVLFVTDCIFNKAQFSDFLVAMVGVILDSHFFRFVCRTIFILSSMINVCGYASPHTIDTFPFCYITFSCFMCTGILSTDWGFTIFFSEHFLAMWPTF